MLDVREIRLYEIRLPLREPFRISSGTVSTRRILLVELLSNGGASAWAECVAGADPNYSPDTIDTDWTVIRQWVAPRVLKRPFERASDVAAVLAQDFRGHEMAKAAIEMGFWGLEAEILQMPPGEGLTYT